MFDIIYICATQQLPTGIELIFLNFIRCKHVKSNYWFKGLCNNTCSNAIGQLCKIKSNLFCHSLIYRSAWTDAQRDVPPISERVGRCCFYETYTPATLLARLQQCCIFHTVDSQRLATRSSRFSQENCLCIDPQCSFCPSAILGPNQGNPEYSIAGTGMVGKWCGQAVKKHHCSVTFHWAFSARQNHKPALGLTQATKAELLQDSPRGVWRPQYARDLLRVFSDQFLHWEQNSKASGWGS